MKLDNGKRVAQNTSQKQVMNAMASWRGPTDIGPAIMEKYPTLDDYFNAQLAALKLVGTGDAQSLQTVGFDEIMQKALDTADAAAINRVFSVGLFSQIALGARTLQSLPHRPWRATGYRAVSAGGDVNTVGVAESAAVGADTEDTFQEISVAAKENETVFSVGNRLMAYPGDDNVTWEQAAGHREKEFSRAMDADMNTDIDTLASNNLESIDRSTASSANQAGVGWTVGDENLHGVTRTANTWFNSNQLANSAVNRDLTLDLIDQLYTGSYLYWGDDYNGVYYVTNGSGWRRWSQLGASNQRQTVGTYSQGTVGTTRTEPGVPGGVKINEWDGRPIVVDDAVTSDGIGRIYMLHPAYTQLAWGRPTENASSDDPFVVGHIRRMLWYNIGEYATTLPRALAQLRDLQ